MRFWSLNPGFSIGAARQAVVAVLLLATLAGCNWITAASVLMRPRQIDKAQFKLTDQRLAVFIDYAKPEQESPVFDRAVYDQLTAVFREQKKFVHSQLVPFDEVLDARRQLFEYSYMRHLGSWE